MGIQRPRTRKSEIYSAQAPVTSSFSPRKKERRDGLLLLLRRHRGHLAAFIRRGLRRARSPHEGCWDSHWRAHKDSSKLMVIDFSATWCGPCRFIEPAFKGMAAKLTDVAFAKIDVDELPEVSRQWRVEAMPTFVLVKGGSEVSRVVGAKKDELERKIHMFMA